MKVNRRGVRVYTSEGDYFAFRSAKKAARFFLYLQSLEERRKPLFFIASLRHEAKFASNVLVHMFKLA